MAFLWEFLRLASGKRANITIERSTMLLSSENQLFLSGPFSIAILT